MRVVIDTNVVVSSRLRRKGKPARVVELALEEKLIFLYDHRIMAEYREVLNRAKFGFNPGAVEVLCRSLEMLGEYVKAGATTIAMRDEDDRPFLEVALSGRADALVTGNRRDFPAKCDVPILTPAELLERIEPEASAKGKQ